VDQRPPTVRGNTDYFVDLMAENGVDKAMLVQSSTHGFDHSYTKEAMNRFPDKFIGCLLADPDNVILQQHLFPNPNSALEWGWRG